jgi:hypothetical protein
MTRPIDRGRIGILLAVLAIAAPASAQRYSAARQGDVVTLTAATPRLVSVAAVGTSPPRCA